MEPKSIATEILQNVENMVDPNAPVEQQLAQLRAQLEALSELPTLISQKLESVNKQMSQISVKKETMKKEVEVVQEQQTQITQKQQTVEARKRKEAHQAHVFYQQQFQPKTPGNQKHSVEITELDPDEEPEGIQIRVTKPSLTGEELDAIQREELRRSLEDVRMRKSVSPMRDASTQSNQREQRPRKPSPAFGPNLQERPVYLPREKRPKMELDENQISETLVGQAEVIRGRAMGVNFKKFEKPPVNLDHLKNSEVYRMIHNMDNEPARGVATLRPAIAAEEYMEGMNLRLAFAIISGGCWSAFQHGYNTGVINAPQAVMSEWLQKEALSGTNLTLTPKDDPKVTTVWSIAVSIYCVGGMIGGVITGVIADRFGRKGGLLLNNVLVFVAAALEGCSKLANSAEMLILGRLVIGINNGLNAGLAPLYLSEISPVSIRGSIGTVYQLVITMTILLSQVLGLGSVLGTSAGWPWLLTVSVLPAVLQCCTLPLCPESPKYLLLNRGAELHAQRALNWLRGDVAVHGEMEEMHQEAEKNKVSKKVNLRELFSNRSLRQPLLIAMMVMLAQQLSGINAVIFFSTDIFKSANLSESQSQYATLGMGAMNVVMTLVSLLLVEVAGRKTLLLAGFAGMTVCSIGLCVANLYVASHAWVSYLCIALVILFVVMFAVGPGSIPWFLVTELFAQAARPAASAVAVTVNWTANFIVGLSFLPLTLVLGSNTFIIFAILEFLFIIFIAYKVPETKNKTIEEITAMFRQQL